MGLKQWLDEHPMAAVMAVVIATATTTAGIVTYFSDVKLTSEKIRMEAEKIKVELEYKSEISSLKNRFTSIERKLGSDEKTYFDVSQLVIQPERIKMLDKSYQSAADGAFFYSAPSGMQWTYKNISTSQFVAMKTEVPNELKKIFDLASAFSEKTFHVWHLGEVFSIHPKPQNSMIDLAPKKLHFFPLVSVEIISESQMKNMLGGFSSYLSLDSELDDIIDSIRKIKNEINALIEDETDSPRRAESSENSTSRNITQRPSIGSEQDLRAADKKLEMENTLGTLFRGDAVAAFLSGLLQQTMESKSIFPSLEISMNSIQKKANVLYMQMTLKFKEVEIQGHPTPKTLIVDREIFVVSNSKHIYIVQVEIPTLDGRSDAYPWVGQWLSSIRLPI